MLSRRLLRVKVIQCLYASMQKGETKLAIAEQELIHSLAKSYELYHVSLSILIELRNYHIKRTELLRKKHLATAEDKNPNTPNSHSRSKKTLCTGCIKDIPLTVLGAFIPISRTKLPNPVPKRKFSLKTM